MKIAVRKACAVVAIAGLASMLAGPVASGAESAPDISGTWWATSYAAKIAVLGGGDPPLNDAGKAQYQSNRAGLRSGSLVDKARKVCAPDGIPRVMETPYPFEIFQVPAGQVTMVHELNHQIRVIPLDKPMRPLEEVAAFGTFNGYSTGRYEGDALVVQSNGFNDDTFLDSTGLPHSDEIVTTERIRKIDGNRLEDVVTIHDPKFYTRDWQARFVYDQRNDIRLQDYSCNDAKHRDISNIAGVNEARRARAEGRLYQ